MELRDDEVAYLEGESGGERCFCGHLYALHNYHCCDYCLICDGVPHAFCSERERDDHYRTQAMYVGNPAVGRKPPCHECEKVKGLP